MLISSSRSEIDMGDVDECPCKEKLKWKTKDKALASFVLYINWHYEAAGVALASC